ncbi:ADP-ribosylation [Hypoxylon rubiginosum]|uniref:ADP-ribosylation n=1 Tax=Hypoxylon rubiginosum TaxID=110542 RepID=A0ACC0DG17_9PEZI|nr:ADP-ribosylation [Hypoxylon rubiginosum]
MAERSDMSEDDLVQLSLLRDFETDELINAGFLSEDEKLTAPLDKELIFKHEELSLRVTAGRSYPAASISWTVDNYTLPIKVVDDLRVKLRRIVETAATNNNISRWRRQEEEYEFGVFEPVMVVLELVKKTQAQLESWRQRIASKDPPVEQELPIQKKPVSSLLTSSDIAFHYLQQTPQEICSRIPSKYRILHVEEVLRDDLARRFHNKREKMRTELSRQSHAALRACVPSHLQHTRRKEVLLEHLMGPRVTFHGTARQFVPSIVRYGFLQPGKKIPGTDKSHDVRCGSTYGRGIYSSPSADFSLSYTGSSCHATKPNEFFGIKLLVCATLMGRPVHMTAADNWRGQSQPYPGADSHIANRDLEYVVFDTAQILPIYVIHIDWGQDNALHFQSLPADASRFVPSRTRRHPRLVENVRFPGEVQRQKAAALARAAKYFPYGFGPATGGRFVVEEIGEVDEDEEEYGEYQTLRGEEIKDKTNLDFWSWVKVGEEMDAAAGSGENLDEYSKERVWHQLDRAAPKWDTIPDPRENDDPEEGEGGDESDDDGFGLDLLMTII